MVTKQIDDLKKQQSKQLAAKNAFNKIKPYYIDGRAKYLGVGTGSTVKYFIDELSSIQRYIEGAVASSTVTAKALESHGIELIDLNQVPEKLPFYVDGADAYNKVNQLTKGGAGALTREKIIANAAENFLCIVDCSKEPEILGKFPIPIEVIPMARSLVAKEIVKLGGRPVWRKNYKTDNGNLIIDIHDLELQHPISMEDKINIIPGVVENGLFAKRPADLILVGE